MTSNNPNFRVSRRNVLAGLGTIGVASAGAGLGTTAFFSDTEALDGWLQAGRVDLYLDYRATYNPWLDLSQESERQRVLGPMGGQNAFRIPEDDGDGYTDAWAIGQAPDLRRTGGGVLGFDEWGRVVRTPGLYTDLCANRSYDPDNGYTGFESALPSGVELGDGSLGSQSFVNGETGVVYDLIDIKPKDEGEVTFSLHLCGNPAFLSMQTSLVGPGNAENGLFEPEDSAGDDSDDFGELGDYLYTELWYDENCNNKKDPGRPVCIQAVVDDTDSMSNNFAGTTTPKDAATKAALQHVVDDLVSSPGSIEPNMAGLIQFGSGSAMGADFPDEGGPDNLLDIVDDNTENGSSGLLTNDEGDIRAAIDLLDANQASSTVEIDDAIDLAGVHLAECDEGSERILLVITDGIRNIGDTVQKIENNAGVIDRLVFVGLESSTNADLQSLFTQLDNDVDIQNSIDVVLTESADTPMELELAAMDAITVTEGGEVCVYAGPLSRLVELTANGVPLSTDNELCSFPDRECFDPGVYCWALRWEFPCTEEEFDRLDTCETDDAGEPVSMGDFLREKYGFVDVNVAQSDGFHFEVDFTAEQCRHNMVCEPRTVDLSSGVADWQVESGPEVTSSGPAAVLSPPFPGTWFDPATDSDPDFPADCAAQWIGHVDGSENGSPAGTHVYSVEFDVSQADLDNGECTLRTAVAVDNNMTIALDGTQFGSLTGTQVSNFSGPHAFETTVDTAGTHVLTIEAENAGGPAGLFVCATLECDCSSAM